MKTLIVIPALNPPEELIDYVERLRASGLEDILIVDDGSSKKFKHIFVELKEKYGCQLLTHAKNLGKGRALKNAFNYFLTMPDVKEYNGLVTADSDGQHRVEDVISMVKEIDKHPESLILGCRDFDSDNVPPKSKFGNKLTKAVFRIFYGRSITDTQTGLRGFPKRILKGMIDISGERFEYETKMLIHTFEENISIAETTIETIYYDNDDSKYLKNEPNITLYIFNESFIGLFQIILWIALAIGIDRGTVPIIVSTVLARVFSSYFNFTMNKNFVFNGEKSIRKTIMKYYSLAAIQMCMSAALVAIIWHLLGGSETVIKIIVDTLLFFISYQIQRRWVFRKEK